MRTKPLTQKEILADILVTTKYTLKVLGGFVISGIVSVFGLYPLVASFFKSETALYITIVGFIGLLILIDSIKRSTLSRYFNSRLKNIILASRVRGSYLNISIMSIVFVLLIDGSGAWLTGVSGAKYYTENKTTNSEEYKLLQANAESGTANKQMYLTLKSDYNSLRAEAVSTCNQKWSVPRYRTKNSQCVDKWDANNKAPSQELLSQKSEVSTADYKNIANENRGFLDEYLQYIIFTVLVLLTGLLQYLTISEIKEDYEDLEDSLTANRISNLQTALATAQDIEEQHEKTTFENKEDMQRKKNEQLRDMDGIADKREIVFNAKAISNGNLGLQRIANNSNAYVPTDEAKAGYVVNPFFSSQDKRDETFYDMEKTIITYDDLESYKALTLKYMDEQIHLDEYLLGKAIYYFKDTKEQWSEITFLEIEDFIKSLNESVKRSNQEPLNGEHQNRAESNQPLNESVITDRKETEPLNGVVKRMDLKNYSDGDLELIDLLWKQSTVKRNDQLETRDNVLKVIGDNKNNTLRLRNLYKKLLADKYIYKRVSYFSNVEV